MLKMALSISIIVELRSLVISMLTVFSVFTPQYRYRLNNINIEKVVECTCFLFLVSSFQCFCMFYSNLSAGEISTSSTSNFNYETLFAAGTTSFVFSVTCSDGQDSDTKSVNLEIINVNEAPYFGQTAYSISADEGVVCTSMFYFIY